MDRVKITAIFTEELEKLLTQAIQLEMNMYCISASTPLDNVPRGQRSKMPARSGVDRKPPFGSRSIIKQRMQQTGEARQLQLTITPWARKCVFQRSEIPGVMPIEPTEAGNTQR